jgi:hypothetical protein
MFSINNHNSRYCVEEPADMICSLFPEYIGSKNVFYRASEPGRNSRSTGVLEIRKVEHICPILIGKLLIRPINHIRSA